MEILLGNNRVSELKGELRTTILKRNRVDDSADLDCGNSLLKVFRPEIGSLESKANAILEELSKLDPSCPKFRY